MNDGSSAAFISVFAFSKLSFPVESVRSEYAATTSRHGN